MHIPSPVFALVAVWCGYFAVHSLLAAQGFKHWAFARWPGLAPAYRLAFNAVALLLLAPPLWLTYSERGTPLWQWQGAWTWVANGLAVAALGAFVWTLRYYDAGEFLGTRQWRARGLATSDTARLVISPLHRFVRHPWYSLALVLIWTRDMDLLFLVTAVVITIYFAVGSWLEERKLVTTLGPAYIEYKRRVPGLVPRPWRYLDKATSARLGAAGTISDGADASTDSR